MYTKVLEKKWTPYLIYFYVHFRRAFVEFVVLLTKVWPKNMDYYGERSVQKAVFGPPPPPPPLHQDMIDAI